MSNWTVEIDLDLLTELNQWSIAQQLELDAIQRGLSSGGPEGIGVSGAEMEGIPSWENLGSPVSLQIPVILSSRLRVLMLEIHPGFKIVVVKLE